MPQSKNYTDPLPLKIYKMKCKSTLARGIHSYLTPSPDYKGVFAKKINDALLKYQNTFLAIITSR
mgnify:CR=1 FL=1